MLWRLIKSALRPAASAERLVQRALELRREGRQHEAHEVLRAAVAAHPRDAAAATNLAVALLEQDRAGEAVPLLERALEIDPGFAPAHFNYGHALRFSGRLGAAIPHYEAAVAGDRSFAPASEALMQALLDACEWDRAGRMMDELRRRIADERPAAWMPFVSPVTAMCLQLDAAPTKAVAAFHAPPPAVSPIELRHWPRRAGDRLRIAYLCREFRNHPTGHMLRASLGLHDRSRFEVHAYSHGADDGSVYRGDVAGSVDHFVDICEMSDAAAAGAIADSGIDVLIDLMGHTTGHRLGILAHRCAPVQAHFLGYPGTIGAPYVDYFIGDPVASPPELDDRFSERVARVPDCYQLNDGSEAFALAPSTRAEHQLPEDAYVFCNFGNALRIDRRSFGLWMRVLASVPGSLLWLLRPSATAIENLQREAARHGIDPARIVFAPPLPKSAHRARLACADLALDTLEWCNGHSTAADMLWSGVPLVTSAGGTFATRVAASILRSADLPDLVAPDDDAFCAIAIAAANDRSRSRALRARLIAAREVAPLFDTRRLIRGLEDVYEAMYAGRI